MSVLRPERSVLATPGSNPGMIAKALASDADVVMIDLEDAVTPQSKPGARAEVLAALREARQRGVVLGAISQCPLGHVDFAVYAAGSALAEAGLVSGGGMTREAALGKLFGLLGAGLPAAEVERLFALDLCGELAE